MASLIKPATRAILGAFCIVTVASCYRLPRRVLLAQIEEAHRQLEETQRYNALLQEELRKHELSNSHQMEECAQELGASTQELEECLMFLGEQPEEYEASRNEHIECLLRYQQAVIECNMHYEGGPDETALQRLERQNKTAACIQARGFPNGSNTCP